jgi:hypothetical protein
LADGGGAAGVGGDAVGEEGHALISGVGGSGKTLMESGFAKKVKKSSRLGVTKSEKN